MVIRSRRVAAGSVEIGDAAQARMDAIRRVLAGTADPAGRGRLRVRLADALTAAGDVTAAAIELKQAAAEAPASVGLLFGARALASRLPPDQARGILAAVGRETPMRVAGREGEVRSAGPASASAVTRDGGDGRRRSSPSLEASEAARAVLVAPPPASLVVAPSEPHPSLRRDTLDRAFAALADGKPVRARKLGEEVARGSRPEPDRLNRLSDLVDGIDRAGARRQSLLLARTLIESAPDEPAAAGVVETLTSLVARALESGDVDLALRWGADLGGPLARVVRTVAAPAWSGGDELQRQFRAAQAATASAHGDEQIEAALDKLGPLLVGGENVMGRAALELALRVAARLGPRAPARRADLLRLAFQQDPTVDGRAYLGRRWMDALSSLCDPDSDGAALALLDRTIDETPADETPLLRGLRAALLRRLGRDAELARALESDAELAIGPELVDLLREQADRLDRIGEPDRALEVRLGALAEAPGDLGLLAPTRQRLEALGQLERSLDLAVAALPHVSERVVRIAHLRDVAALAETAGDDRQRAASSWLEVLALDPGDEAAFDAAERLLRDLGDEPRRAELLAWAGARTVEPEARLAALWRLAELRRSEGRTASALFHYREIIEARGRSRDADPLGEDWRRRDDRLAVETARTLAAPHPAARAQALTDRALALIEAARLDDAERDLSRAFDLNPEAPEVLAGFETLHERRGDWRGLRQRLQSRVGDAAPSLAARLWCGIGRASERLNDLAAAESAYAQAHTADPADRAPLAALRRLATARRDWAEASRLLEKEIGRVRSSAERVPLLLEQGALLDERLDRPDQAVEVLEAALAFQPANVEALEAMYRAAVRAGVWEKSAQALEGLIVAGAPVGDVDERYHRIGRAAEAGGKVERALGFYSRSYARNPGFRPTLERLSEICFDRQQWDNAWKATEHLIDRHGADMEPGMRAELALRSALADLHVAQRIAAAARVAAMPGLPTTGGGLREVADSWASMRFDPRLLAAVDDDRRGRVRSRLREVLSLTERTPAHPARETARATWAVMAMADQRWADAVEVLDTFGGDGALDAPRRCRFLVAAGDILLHRQGDAGGAALRYERARALNPDEPRLARAGVVRFADELTDDKVPPSR